MSHRKLSPCQVTFARWWYWRMGCSWYQALDRVGARLSWYATMDMLHGRSYREVAGPTRGR